jgi:uncharacterized protein YndB with AHSA1/START domain
MTTTDTLRITTPNDLDVVLTRVFDAPRAMVFDALTKPELLKRWYGPDGWSLDVCEIDLRPGGRWRFVVRRPDGKPIGQYGVYREITPAERIVNTERWEDWDPGETLVTTVLAEDKDGRTTMTSTSRFPSKDVRDTVLKSGLEHGAAQTYDKLAELLALL